jgi:hypothetical protein
MQETIEQYKERLLGYGKGKEPIELQQATAKRLATLLKGKSKSQLTRRPAADKWSVAEIVAHLADAEVANSWRYRQILSTNAVPMQAYDQDRWAATFDYAKRDPKQSLELFNTLRAANLSLLKASSKKLWDNYGVHQERGNESVSHLVKMIAGHDVNHLLQIENIIKNGKAKNGKR